MQVLPESGKQSLTPLKPALLPWPAGLSHPIAPRLIPFPLLLRHAPITLAFLSSSDTNRPSSLQPKGPCRDALSRHRGEAAPWMERASAFTSPPRQPSLAAPSLNTVSNTPFQVLHSTCHCQVLPWSFIPLFMVYHPNWNRCSKITEGKSVWITCSSSVHRMVPGIQETLIQ